MQFQIGPLNKRIILESPPVPVSDGMGGDAGTAWVREAEVWAAIWPTTAKEAVSDRQPGLGVTHRIRIRYRAGLKSSWRVRFGARYFNITSVVNPSEQNRALDLICEEAA